MTLDIRHIKTSKDHTTGMIGIVYQVFDDAEPSRTLWEFPVYGEDQDDIAQHLADRFEKYKTLYETTPDLEKIATQTITQARSVVAAKEAVKLEEK
jgi:hypothetical protein